MSEKVKLLIVDDSAATLEILRRNLQSKGYSIFTATSVDEAIGILESAPIDLVITDFKMPGRCGDQLITHVHENYGDTEVMMITGYATVAGAVKAIKQGAEEYLAKPFTDEELFAAVDRSLKKLEIKRALRSQSVVTPLAPRGFIGESSSMKAVYSAIAKAARTTATVLLSGESGTGKELAARAIHYSSPRAAAPFVAVNCGGIPEGLLESELFGHVKGAFTGAVVTRAGFFQTADGGTIFLDEIGETSIAMQVKLLRVLQDHDVCMIGSTRRQTVDVRILAATNKDLLTMVGKGAFREDLYYRLNVVPIELPPLRNRGDDILALLEHFVEKYAPETTGTVPAFTDKALLSLRRYNWPGNVRELENVVRRLLVMTDGNKIDVSDLPPLLRGTMAKEHNFRRTLSEVEQEYIKNVLDSVDGNKSKAARILGIDRKTLREKLKQQL